MPDPSQIPRITDQPKSDDVVAVLMTEEVARRFEKLFLMSNTRHFTRLSPPMLFSDDDVPTYTIVVDA